MWLTPHRERVSREESRKTGAPFPAGGPKEQGDEILLVLFSCQAQISLSHSQGLGEGWEEVSRSSQESRTAEV